MGIASVAQRQHLYPPIPRCYSGYWLQTIFMECLLCCHILTQLMFTIILQGWYPICPHFIDGELRHRLNNLPKVTR